ncbi:Alpha/Beta hydrolase protein [Flagelloscypha sp. PMI_526]|nr:Alpha/Beta hydrolase protein [Flagelloscypha sp. PMI_526]
MLHSQSVTIPQGSGQRFQSAAKCYTWSPSMSNNQDHDLGGITLVLAHCVGSHKEQWEPFLESLFSACNGPVNSPVRIQEAWALDRINHGDSYVLNVDALGKVPEDATVHTIWNAQPDGTSAAHDALAFATFLRSSYLNGRRVVLIGHSAGGTSIILGLKSLIPQQIRQIEAVVLIEPAIATKTVFETVFEDRVTQMELAFGGTTIRRDTWDTKATTEKGARDEVFNWFLKRFPWNAWDESVVRRYADYGLRVSSRPNASHVSLSLKTPKLHEAACFVDTPASYDATDALASICAHTSVHLLFADAEDFMPISMKESLYNAQEGRKMKSVTYLEDSGHFLLQEKPREASKAVADILKKEFRRPFPSKL